jgi:hypothetical protein
MKVIYVCTMRQMLGSHHYESVVRFHLFCVIHDIYKAGWAIDGYYLFY